MITYIQRLVIIIFRLYDSKTKIEAPKASIYDSAIKLDPQNSQFILFYQERIKSYEFCHLTDVTGKSLPTRFFTRDPFYKAKVDKEIKQMQEELEKLRRQAKEMYSIEMKSCMDMVKVTMFLSRSL